MNTSKKVGVLTVGVGAWFAAGSAFVPGTAEAHCSPQHPNCGAAFVAERSEGCGWVEWCNWQPCCDQAASRTSDCNPGGSPYHCQAFGLTIGDCWYTNPGWSYGCGNCGGCGGGT